MAPGSLEPGNVPGVLDSPVARRQDDASYERRPARDEDWLPALEHGAEPEHPVGMLAAARERPPAVDSPATGDRLGRPRGLGRAGEDRVGTVAVDLVVGLAQQ